MSAARQRRILFTIPEDWYVCSHRLPLLRGAVQAGYEVTVVTRVARHAAPIEATGAKLVHTSLQRGFKNPLTDLRGLLNLVRIYRRVRPDIVHHVTPKSVLFGSLAAWLTRVPRVVNALAGLGILFASDSTAVKLVRPLVVAAFRWLLGRSNSCVIVQNRDDESYFADELGVPRERVHLIRGAGVDTVEFTPAEAEPPAPYRVAVVSRMLFEKGIAETVAAADAIAAQRDDVQFLIAGEPDTESPSGIPRSQLEAWDRDHAVTWLGRVDDVAGLLKTCHVGLLASYYREGLPKCLLEAAACGLPVVATDAPGCREICHPDRNGLLIPVRDAEAIVAAVLRLVDDVELRCRLGAGSRELVEREFAEKRVVDDTLAVYREISP